MNKPTIINAHIRAGVWQAEIAGDASQQPDATVSLQGKRLDDLQLHYNEMRGLWLITVPIPVAAINDGIQTFVVHNAHGETLAHFSILAGDAATEDLRAEIDLLRSEMDILKAAFRRHCAET